MLRWVSLLPEVTVTAFGEARAVCTPRDSDIDFLNTVHRLRPEDVEQVPLIAEHYRAAAVQPWLELSPAPEFDRLADALADAGGRHLSFTAVHERDLPAGAPDALPPGVTVREVGPEHDDFVWVLPQGHGRTEAELAEAIRRTRAQSRVEGARQYLATVDGRPAAAAVLFQAGGLAYLASASTLEPLRRRGCQTALIQRRLADAAAAGCRRVATLTTWGSQSHANMARAGFRTVYTSAVWRLP
jgi:N-acetylglutamate synthase-like GNAT family acetyltransferase